MIIKPLKPWMKIVSSKYVNFGVSPVVLDEHQNQGKTPFIEKCLLGSAIQFLVILNFKEVTSGYYVT